MLRLLLTIAIAIGITRIAAADSDLVVLGPAAPEEMKASVVGDAKQAVERAVGKGIEVGPSCAIDVACVKATASERAARRALAVSLEADGKQVKVTLLMIDIVADEQLGKRDLTFATRKLERELGSAVRKFLDEAPTGRAKELFAQGNQHYELGEFAKALELYKRAYQIKPLAEFLFNIGQCHRKLGQHKEAIAMYQSYLVGVPNADNKPLVDDLIAESKGALDAADRRESERLAAEQAEQLRKAREAEAMTAKERRRTEQVKSKKRVLPWFAIGLGAAAIVGGATLYFTSETDDGTQPTYRDSRPAGIGVAIGGGVLTATGLLWVARF